MSQKNTHQSKKTNLSPKLARNWKRGNVLTKLDFTGRNPFMVVENLQKQRVIKKDNYKEEQHLLSTVEKPVDIVDGSAQEPVVEHEHTTMVNNIIGRQEFAQMPTEKLRIYAISLEVTLRNHKSTWA
ncbi:8007_t:CDS:2 [Paraglomus brasilianum]|uniref:8007_t:CDS:1 n=1 Tax=Paraglomus brasilianum TaxID=144538 RepID=A0A9N9BQT9_9GLOM|nr:8007_t:CDS:2 [Paraglomus brasilianum]